MKTGWQTKKLGEVCSFLNRGISPKYLDTGGICVLNQKCIRDHRVNYKLSRRHDGQAKRIGIERIVQAGDVLVNSTGTGTLGRVAQICETPVEATTVDSHITIVRPIPGKFNFTFFGYMLILIEDRIKDSGEGCGGQTELARSVLAEKFSVSYPDSIYEQQRIVAILDEAFAAIATAKANTEKNLQNARALFESYLESIFAKRGDGWVEKTLGNICERVSVGHVGPTSRFYCAEGLGIPFVRSQNVRCGGLDFNGIRYITNEFHKQLKKSQLRGGDLLFVRVGANRGDCCFVPEGLGEINCANIVFARPKDGNAAYLERYCQSTQGKSQLLDMTTGAAQGVINTSSVAELIVPLPSVSEQQRIVDGLNTLEFQARGLESIYKRKLALLDELKKSLLHQAFTGELTSQSQHSVVIPFPTKIPDISTTDLHAGILAMAYQLHEEKGNAKQFGHVKAEKISHMLEAHVGIDLDRSPIKDAAGPNDFPHLKKIESRARKAHFFDFQYVEENRYQVKKLNGFDGLINRVRNALGEQCGEVDRLLQLMLPMTPREAEIFCTVYAAWNNLLLDGLHPSNEDIVYEARENWHPDKLKIQREKFFAAIEQLKEQGIVPSGRGKKVTAKIPKK